MEEFLSLSPSLSLDTARPGTPDDVRKAFAPTLARGATASSESATGGSVAPRPFLSGDVRLLDDIASVLRAIKII